MARATPLGPEVDDHLAVSLEDLVLERLGRCICCHWFLSSICTRTSLNAEEWRILPARYDRTHVYPALGHTRSSGTGAGAAGRLGAGEDVRAAARTEPGRGPLVVHRRACDGEQGGA